MSDQTPTPPAPIPPTPAPTPPAPPPVNIPWTFYAIIGLVMVGALCIFAAGMWSMGLLSAPPVPVPPPPVPPAAIALTVPADVTLGEQFVVQSDASAPVTWIEHGLPGMKGHVGAETKVGTRYAGSYAVTACAKGRYPVIAATIVNGKIVTTSKLIDLADPTPPPSPVPPPPGPVPPPAPVDPLTAAFQAAYAKDADADRAKSLAFLQAIYPAMAAGIPSPPPATNALAMAWMKSKIAAPGVGLVPTQLVNLRKAIGAELSTALGTDPTALTNVTIFPAELTKIGNSLTGVK